MKKRGMDYLVTLIGILLLGTGFILHKTYPDAMGILLTFPYICIGIGCGALGTGVGNMINKRAMKNSPDLQKRLEIDINDERNVAIRNQAKAKAYDIMVYVYSALMLTFALLNVSLAATLLLVFAYLFVVSCGVYYRCKYDKEM